MKYSSTNSLPRNFSIKQDSLVSTNAEENLAVLQERGKKILQNIASGLSCVLLHEHHDFFKFRERRGLELRNSMDPCSNKEHQELEKILLYRNIRLDGSK